jgi:hypothetical protein
MTNQVNDDILRSGVSDLDSEMKTKAIRMFCAFASATPTNDDETWNSIKRSQDDFYLFDIHLFPDEVEEHVGMFEMSLYGLTRWRDVDGKWSYETSLDECVYSAQLFTISNGYLVVIDSDRSTITYANKRIVNVYSLIINDPKAVKADSTVE